MFSHRLRTNNAMIIEVNTMPQKKRGLSLVIIGYSVVMRLHLLQLTVE